MQSKFVLILPLAAIAAAAGAQDAPVYSYDYSGQSMALTSSAIAGASVADTAREQPARRAAPQRRPAAPASRPATADDRTKAACNGSTPILRSMGLQPAAECR